jgi:hypothetical protein
MKFDFLLNLVAKAVRKKRGGELDYERIKPPFAMKGTD